MVPFSNPEHTENATEIPNTSQNIPPPPRPSSSPAPGKSEPMPQSVSKGLPNVFIFAFAIWCHYYQISRRQYTALLEVLALLQNLSDLQKLPRTATWLKSTMISHLPMLPMRKQEVALNADKLPTYSAQEKRGSGPTMPKGWLYWFEPTPLIQSLLATPALKKEMYFGMARLVDNAQELWESHSWASSLRSTSGNFVHYPNKKAAFPGDFVYFKCTKSDCTCTPNSAHFGRMFAYGEDHRSTAAKKGEVTLIVQLMWSNSDWPEDLAPLKVNLTPKFEDNEWVLLEDQFAWIPESNLFERFEGWEVNYTFDNGIHNEKPNFSPKQIRRILNVRKKDLRPASQMSPLRAELEIKEYTRAYWEGVEGKLLSLPMLFFIDGFGLYRNMYRSLMGVYISFACQTLRQRTRRKNVFVLTYGPHASDFDEVITCIEDLPLLDKGKEMIVDPETKETKIVCCYCSAFLGDMPEQNSAASFQSQNSEYGCRNCVIPKKERGDLDFDIVHKGRYHNQLTQFREFYKPPKKSKAQYVKLLNKIGLKETPSALTKIAPALDIIRSRPGDPAHSEYNGIGKQAQMVLLSAILTPQAQLLYAAELRRFPFPPGWGRLQSPIKHLKSWRMQEAARSMIITPVLLRCWLEEDHIQRNWLAAFRRIFASDMQKLGITSVEMVVRAYALIAKSTSVIMAPAMSLEDKLAMEPIIREGRRMFQGLFEAAARACGATKKTKDSTRERASSAASDTSTSTAGGEINPQDAPNDAPEFADEDPDIEIITGKKSASKSKKAKTFRSFQCRMNLHQALHYADVAFEYGTVYNVNVLPHEDKHKPAKDRITFSNGRDVEKFLLHFENVEVTIRTTIGGAFRISHPEMTILVQHVYQQCPTLFDSFLPIPERDDDEDEDELIAKSDAQHRKVSVRKKLSPREISGIEIRGNCQLPLTGRVAESDAYFARALKRAYRQDYEMEFVTGLGNQHIHYSRQVSFFDPVTEHRRTFSTGDFIRFRGTQIGRFEVGFLHAILSGEARFFAFVTLVKEFAQKDDVLGLPLMEMQGEVVLVGLPAISSELLYMVPKSASQRSAVPQVNISRDPSHLESESQIIRCTWHIGFV